MDSSIFKPLKQLSGSEWSGHKKFLSTTLGSACPFVVIYHQNILHVYHLERNKKVYTFEFPEGVKIVDVDYFPNKDGLFGILVGANDENLTWGAQNFVVGLESQLGSHVNLKLAWTLGVPEAITVVKTLFTNEDMHFRAKEFKLFSKLEKWPHVVAIGANNSRCFIGNLQQQEDFDTESVLINTISQNIVDIFTSFRSKSRNTFTYEVEDLSKTYDVAAVSVSSLALLPRSRTLLVGLSMGGIISAALNPSNAMNRLSLRHERLIRYIVPLEPEDDPERYEYFMAIADGSPRHQIMIHLWRGCFKTEDNLDAVAEKQFDEPQFYVNMEYRMPFGKNWISARTMTHGRGISNMNRTRRITLENSMSAKSPNVSSMLNCSQSLGSTLNRSSILLVYEKIDINTNKTFIEAAVFDIDAYYYKRMPATIRDDQTCLKQCAFMSTIKSNIESDNIEDVMILLNSPTDISRFSSPISEADQLFYPSSLNFDRVFIATKESVNRSSISSIHNTLLEEVSNKLEEIVGDASNYAEKLLAAGFVPKTILNGSPNNSINSSQLSGNSYWSVEQKIVLTSMLYYGKVDSLIKLADSQILTSEMKGQIAEWVYYECCNFKRTILDRTYSVFDGSSAGLSPHAESALTNGLELFYSCEVLFGQYHKALQQDVDQNIKRIRKFAENVHLFWIYNQLIRQFVAYGIVPTKYENMRKMRELHFMKVEAARKNKCALPVQLVIRRMNMVTPDALFWDETPYDQWYPPHPSNLLDPILTLKITEKVKRELIIHYVLDWLRACGNISDEKELAKKAHCIIKDKLMGSDLQKIEFILEEEKRAICEKPKPQVFKTLENNVQEKKLPDFLTEKQKEEFEARYQLQKEKSSFGLTKLNEEEEKQYQAFLLVRQRYNYLSDETVNSNKLLQTFLSSKKCANVSSKQAEKSEKQRDIQNAVKNMFQKNKSNANETVMMQVNQLDCLLLPPNSIAHKVQQMNIGRKRRSINEGNKIENEPNSKRLPPNKSPKLVSPPPVDDNSSDDEILVAAQTPAKYLSRRPIKETELSPVFRPGPPTTCPNSILKSTKTIQSPSRGRIRFHQSVGGFEEESADEGSIRSVGKKLNFDFDDDEDENETENVPTTAPIQQPQTEDTFELSDAPTIFEDIEKTFEIASECSENMDVSEKKEIVEKSFEVAEELVEEQTKEKDNEVEMEKTMEISEEVEDSVEKDNMEVVEEETVEKESVEANKIVTEEVEKTTEIMEEVEVVEEKKNEDIQVEEEKETEKEIEMQEEEEKEEEEKCDGIERSFELQKDEDVEPIREPRNTEITVENVEDSLRRSSRIRSRTVSRSEEQQESETPATITRTNTRSRTNSVSQQNDEKSIATSKKRTNIRSRTVSRNEDNIEEEKKEELMEVENVETPVRKRTRSTSRSRNPSVSVETPNATPKKATKSASRGRTAVIEEENEKIEVEDEPKVQTPKRGRPPKSANTTPSKNVIPKLDKVIEEKTEAKKDEIKIATTSSRSRSRTTSVIEEPKEATPKKVGRPRRENSKSPARAKKVEEEETSSSAPRNKRSNSVSRMASKKEAEELDSKSSTSRLRAASVATTTKTFERPRGIWRERLADAFEKSDPKAAAVVRSVSMAAKPIECATLTPRRSARRK